MVRFVDDECSIYGLRHPPQLYLLPSSRSANFADGSDDYEDDDEGSIEVLTSTLLFS
uniref:Uncharacterized protein n=1 Tax=Hyaloperonospora arabidopsidis (strain Emoy2) TaxID=559515 RepID=M4B1L2_HYAAE